MNTLIASTYFIFNLPNFFINIIKKYFFIKKTTNKYFIKLDGYYYCKQLKSSVAVLRARNKRTTEKVLIKDIINDKQYLQELHPLDACIIGIIANNDRNNIIDQTHIGWKKMSRSKGYQCSVKSKPILEIIKKFNNDDGVEICVLYAAKIKRELQIPTLELCQNQALLYALDSFEAITLGYDASELFLRKINDGGR